jgi:hypothetical protein
MLLWLISPKPKAKFKPGLLLEKILCERMLVCNAEKDIPVTRVSSYHEGMATAWRVT